MNRLKDITENRMLMRAGGITLVIYLLFALLARPDVKPLRRPRPHPLQLSYVSLTDSHLKNMESLWSPVLFSFPNKQGFSGVFLKSHDFQTEIARSEPDRFSELLETPLAIHGSATRNLLAQAAPTLQRSTGKPESVFKRPHATAPAGIYLKVADGLASRLILQPDLNTVKGLPAGSWQQVASITVDTYGQVTHAFIQPQGKPAQPAPPSLINALYLLRFQPADTVTQGRVTVYSLNGDPAE